MYSRNFVQLPGSLRARSRRGAALSMVVFAVVVLLILGITAWYLTRSSIEHSDEPMLAEVTRGPYELVVVEQGEVESSNNVEIRCEVKSRGTNGTALLEVVAEGTHVKEGDLLARLDSSTLDRESDQQQIMVNTSYGLMVTAGNVLEAANVAKEEYLQGAYKQEEQLVLSEIFVAEENLKRAQLSVESGERLAAKGLVTTLQLDGDRFAVDKARNELDAAQTKLRVLREFTKKKMLIQFDSDIKTAEVKYENEKKNYEVERKKLKDIEDQIGRCTIRAPQAGQVVYANIVSSRGGSSEFVVEPGALVREQQVIIRLPDPQLMQVKAKINESRIALVKANMPVSIRIDAFGEGILAGNVIRVNQYAEPSGWYSSPVKEYGTFIDISEPPPGIRPGLTAEVRIHVESKPDALQIPVQALYEFKNHTFCLIKKGESWETREVSFESTNDKTVALKAGALDVGEQVVLNPRRHSDLMKLPDIPDPPSPEEKIAAKKGGKVADSKSKSSSNSKKELGASQIVSDSADARAEPKVVSPQVAEKAAEKSLSNRKEDSTTVSTGTSE